ncbi:N-acetylglucosamine-6-phosphate deacetylase [Tunturiibacter gelidoferens]|uniref:N-acetylglucosamine-6-phosphate deacetylase n=1 Tax=Tunturiibacter gelidiferens TaxID=3069689 RepID=A0A9X0U5N0_9BACT|nr:amidohydrolase family protein [Edaphobacter lichenicola]MBB5330696.1 N-acetylglucosamine-6-phosphate deacetylase [Edaphobacter lichenicola]
MTTITGRDPQSGHNYTLVVDEGVIVRVEESSASSDLFLSPGLVDLQVNGCSGFDVNSPQLTPDTITELVDAMLFRGVTCFAPTIITAPEDKICHALSIIAEARQIHPRAAACIPFVHVEGPHISPLDGYRGAHPAHTVRPPSIEEFERWQQASGGLVGMVTLSPHFEESCAYIATLVKQGIYVAIGHTHASPQEILRAIDAGARLATHLGNGIAPEIPRHRNAIWSLLADDRVSATFIADGHHLPPDVLKVMLRAKTLQRSVLVSDSVALAGMPPGTYVTPVGGRVELRPDGRLCVFGSELLAGATASLAQGISTLVRTSDVLLHEALAMATTNPGKLAGGRGQLTTGSRADLLRFRWQDSILIEDVWLAGEQVHTRTEVGRQPGR